MPALVPELQIPPSFSCVCLCRAALEMGLSPNQLLLLEEFAEALKGGRVQEERLVAQLQQRVCPQ